jgi:peptidoglycan/LPS O-acetylase OafA/YrhL
MAALIMVLVANATRILLLLLHNTGWQIWANTFSRLDPMAGGILLAVCLGKKSPTEKPSMRLLIIAIATTCLVLTGYLVELHPGVTWVGILTSYPLVAASCTAIVYAFINFSIRMRAFEYLGKISYGLYVYHLTCTRLADRFLTLQPGLLHAVLRPAVALAVTVAVSATSYKLLESPFLRLKRRFTYIPSRPV